jgi:TolA-binding protein
LTDMAAEGEKEYLLDDASQALQRGTLLEVTRKFEWLLRRDPNNAFAAAELARTWALLEDREQAMALYKRAIELYLKRNEVREAAARFEEMRNFWPDAMFDTESHFRIACILDETGECQRAADAFAQIYCYQDGCSEAEMAMLRSGQIQLTRLDRPELAAAILEKFVQSYPQSQWRTFAEQALARARQKTQERRDTGEPQE